MDLGADDRPGEGSFPLLTRFASTGLGRKREAEFQRCGQPYMLAMLNGQMLEVLTKLAAPALAAPVEDDAASSEMVRRGLKNPFARAIDKLAEQGRLSVELTPALTDELHRARMRRNELAHDWIWIVPLRVLMGEAEELTAELEADSQEFGRLSALLMDEVFGAAVRKRGVTLDQVLAAADLVGARIVSAPTRYTGISFKLPAVAEFFLRLLGEKLDDLGPVESDAPAG